MNRIQIKSAKNNYKSYNLIKIKFKQIKNNYNNKSNL